MQATPGWFERLVQKEVECADPYEDRGMSIGIVVVAVMVASLVAAHQVQSTGFLAPGFGPLEAVLLYGTLAFWAATAALIIAGRKEQSRDLDLGGLFFAAAACAWLLVVYPFDFTHVGDVTPAAAGFLVEWISDGVARVLLVLALAAHLGLGIGSALLRLAVHRARAARRA